MDLIKKQLLTVDFGKRPQKTVSAKNNTESDTSKSICVLCLGNSTQIPPWKNPFSYQIKWKDIKECSLKGFNFFLTLNPDPSCDWYTTDRDKKVLIPKFLTMMETLRYSGKLKSCVCIYEYGKGGKKGGKMHFHVLLKTRFKHEMLEVVYNIFNNRTNCRHRTVQCRNLRSVDDRNYQFYQYMRKESHNQETCLYYL